MNIESVDMLQEGDKAFWAGRWETVEADVTVQRGVATLKFLGREPIETEASQVVFTNSISVTTTDVDRAWAAGI